MRSLGHGPILSGLIYVGALWLGRSISFALHSPVLFEAFFVEQPSVYTGLVLFSFLLRPVELLLGLLLNMVSRAHERQADRFAVETTHEKAPS